MRILNALYTAYSLLIFLVSCTLFVPLMILLSQRKSWHHVALKIHQIWSRIIFMLWFIRVEISGKEKLKQDQQYIFCANHFSYLDIPSFFLLWHAKFIGKSSLNRIPLFGYFYRNIHIPVNRSSFKSRADSLAKTRQAIDEGFNVAFFPEGGIRVAESDLPYMVPFKDGAFRLAVETGTTLVPITMPYNFERLPDKSPLRLYPGVCKLVVHDPVSPLQDGEDEIKKLKDQSFKIIQDELISHHPDKVRRDG